MISFEEVLTEAMSFKQYKAVVRITYNDNPDLKLGAEKIAEMLRALPGATRVSTVSLDKDKTQVVFDVKVISQKSPKDCFIALKKNAMERFGEAIKKFEVGAGTIETKAFIR